MYQEKYDLHEINGYISDLLDIVFVGTRDDDRSLYLKNNIDNYKGKYIYLEADDTFDKLSTRISDESTGQITEYDNQVLISGIRELLRSLDVEQRNVCIDITGMQHIIFFLLIKLLLTEYNPKLLFAAYTEPEEYIRDDCMP